MQKMEPRLYSPVFGTSGFSSIQTCGINIMRFSTATRSPMGDFFHTDDFWNRNEEMDRGRPSSELSRR
jgi:hypothetical protein